MWRTFWKDVCSPQELDSFLNQIEDSGFVPAFIREQNISNCERGRWSWLTRVIISARKKEAQ